MSIINGAGLNSFRSQFTAGTTYALAEIIDNSIQWKQKGTVSEINIVLIESQPGWHMRDVFIIDNGVGMDEETIQTCLDFGGGKNHGTTENGKLGKFGLGLPYSSCSQSPNYHVYSWQQKGEYLHNYRNHKDYGPGDPVESNEVTKSTSLPSKIIEAFNDVVPTPVNVVLEIETLNMSTVAATPAKTTETTQKISNPMIIILHQ